MEEATTYDALNRMTSAGKLYDMLYDGSGNVYATLYVPTNDSAGYDYYTANPEVKNRIGYTPYGDSNGEFDLTGGPPTYALNGHGSTASELRYRGYLLDQVSGWYVTGARMYDPSVGAFTTEDPARADGNWYSYCGGNPVGRWDPSGLCSLKNTPNGTLKDGGKSYAYDPDSGYLRYEPWTQEVSCNAYYIQNCADGQTFTNKGYGYDSTVKLCPGEIVRRTGGKTNDGNGPTVDTIDLDGATKQLRGLFNSFNYRPLFPLFNFNQIINMIWSFDSYINYAAGMISVPKAAIQAILFMELSMYDIFDSQADLADFNWFRSVATTSYGVGQITPMTAMNAWNARFGTQYTINNEDHVKHFRNLLRSTPDNIYLIAMVLRHDALPKAKNQNDQYRIDKNLNDFSKMTLRNIQTVLANYQGDKWYGEWAIMFYSVFAML